MKISGRVFWNRVFHQRRNFLTKIVDDDVSGVSDLWQSEHNCAVYTFISSGVNHFWFYLQTTPLHLAAERGHPEVISLLLSKGADITLTDHKGKNCLDLAVDYGHKYVSSLILKNCSCWLFKALLGWASVCGLLHRYSFGFVTQSFLLNEPKECLRRNLVRMYMTYCAGTFTSSLLKFPASIWTH